jgi:beta-N-acetylhexosaminidase
MRTRIAIGALALILTACSSGNQVAPTQPGALPTPSPSPSPTRCDPRVAVAALPLDTRIRQLLFAGVYTGDPDPIGSATAAASAGVGGINFLGNDSSSYANGELAGVAAAGGRIPPFLAVDEEGGRVQRLKAITGSVPSARTMGKTMTPAQVQELAAQVGGQLARLGLTMDLAPVADVSSQPNDSVIGDRSFSDDPAVAAQYAGAFADGLRSAGIVPVLKHFPGIGSASGNTDTEVASTPPLSQLEAADLVPYQTLLAAQPVAVMIGNAVVPDLTNDAPASLSPPAVDLLRTKYGFDGVAMTDSLSAKAITSVQSLPGAVELAIAAGVDMALWDSTSEIDQVVAELSAAVSDGRLPEARVNEAAARVLALKKIDACDLTGQ